MRLLPYTTVAYECSSCGARHRSFPAEPCCQEDE
jgi:hypothetical protein